MDIEHGSDSNLLNLVQEGMRVYDQQEKEIGRVKSLFLGEAAPEAEAFGQGPAQASTRPLPGQDNWFDEHPSVSGGSEAVPPAVRAQLRRQGFLRVESPGILSGVRYVLPAQIAQVTGDRVYLNVSHDQLISG